MIWAGSAITRGYSDGALEKAEFNNPAYLAMDPFNSDFILVADKTAIRSTVSKATSYQQSFPNPSPCNFHQHQHRSVLSPPTKMRDLDQCEIRSAIICLALKINPRLIMNGLEIANSLYALSKMRDLDQHEIRSTIICLAKKIHPRLDVNGQNVANSLNALSKLRDLDQQEIKSAIICLAEMISPRLPMNGKKYQAH
jgi:hypothetical protein